MTRYPENITFARQRHSDGDMEILGTLNGESLYDEDGVWNLLVNQTLAIFRLIDSDVEAYEREDVYSIIDMTDAEEWTPIKTEDFL
jgi:hypothetical protein